MMGDLVLLGLLAFFAVFMGYSAVRLVREAKKDGHSNAHALVLILVLFVALVAMLNTHIHNMAAKL